jgi:hypothetical protein
MSSHAQSTLALGSWLVKSDMLIELERSLPPAEWQEYRESVARYWHAIAYQCLKAGLLVPARRGFLRALRRTRTPATGWLAAKGLLTSMVPGPLRQMWWRAANEPADRAA